jgi:hypothetical protein
MSMTREGVCVGHIDTKTARRSKVDARNDAARALRRESSCLYAAPGTGRTFPGNETGLSPPIRYLEPPGRVASEILRM